MKGIFIQLIFKFVVCLGFFLLIFGMNVDAKSGIEGASGRDNEENLGGKLNIF